jgi:hypothetical protein
MVIDISSFGPLLLMGAIFAMVFIGGLLVTWPKHKYTRGRSHSKYFKYNGEKFNRTNLENQLEEAGRVFHKCTEEEKIEYLLKIRIGTLVKRISNLDNSSNLDDMD